MSCTYAGHDPSLDLRQKLYRCQIQEAARPVASPRTARAADPARIGNPTCTTSGDAQKPAPVDIPAPEIPRAQFEKVFIFSLLTCNFPLCNLIFSRSSRVLRLCFGIFSITLFLVQIFINKRAGRSHGKTVVPFPFVEKLESHRSTIPQDFDARNGSKLTVLVNF